MSISVTCSCGARLEIDDKFAGKSVPCPDCQRPLNTTVAEQARELPVSGLAITSLVLATAGALTVLGSLAAVGVGIAAMRQIAREPKRFSGINIARAGTILGGVFTLVVLAALMSNDAFGVDALLRVFRHASDLDYKTGPGGQLTISQTNGDHNFLLQRPSSSWGKLKTKGDDKDLLMLVNLRSDAHLVCMSIAAEDKQGALDKAADRFRQSDLFRYLGRSGDTNAQSPELEAKKVPENDSELTVDVRLGGYDRTFLLRVVKMQKGGDMFLLAGGARKGRFGRTVDEIRRSFDSFKIEEAQAE